MDRYDVLVFDPPWPSEFWMDGLRAHRRADSGYGQHPFPMMQFDQIEKLANEFIHQHAAENCHIFVWATAGFLREALRIIEGVEGVSLGRPLVWVWKKDGGPKPPALPVHNAEFIIYARKGSPKFIDGANFRICFDAKRRGASVKPDEFYNMIRTHTAGRRLDVFNRRRIEGFDGWGLESPGMFVEGNAKRPRETIVDAEELSNLTRVYSENNELGSEEPSRTSE
jgi:N6-adenosine-specific RNA methylase IME4